LQNSAGFLQSKIGERIDTRYIPKLTFVLDKGVKQSIEISRMLGELLPKPTDEELAEVEDDVTEEQIGDEEDEASDENEK
jgi:ribosome-binding factor A